MLALTVLQHGNGNFKLNFHRDLREIESFFEACLAAAATLTFLRSLVRHLARFAHARRRFWPRGRCLVAVPARCRNSKTLVAKIESQP